MNAKELLEYFDLHARREWSAASHETVLRALRLLDAAEANEGTTPKTDMVAWKENNEFTAFEDAEYVPADFARRLERERNALAARVAELERGIEIATDRLTGPGGVLSAIDAARRTK